MNQPQLRTTNENVNSHVSNHHQTCNSDDWSFEIGDENSDVSSVRKRLRSSTIKTELITEPITPSQPKSDESRKVRLTLCKVSNSTDCYAVKSKRNISKKNTCKNIMKEIDCLETAAIKIPVSSSGTKDSVNGENQPIEKTLPNDAIPTMPDQVADALCADTHTLSLFTPKSQCTKEGSNEMHTDSHNFSSDGKSRSPRKKKGKCEDKTYFVNNLGLQALPENDFNAQIIESPFNNNQKGLSSTPKIYRNTQYYGTGKLPCPDLGEGWFFEQIVRQQGKSAGQFDVYYYSPTNIRLRSKLKLKNFIGNTLDMTLFDYNAGRYKQDNEFLPKKEALRTDKLQWYEGKHEPGITLNSEFSPNAEHAKDDTPLKTKKVSPSTAKKPGVKVKLKRKRRIKYFHKRFKTVSQPLIKNVSLETQDISEPPSKHINEVRNDNPLEENSVIPDESPGLVAFKKDVEAICGDMLDNLQGKNDLVTQAWKYLSDDKKLWFKDLQLPLKNLSYASPTIERWKTNPKKTNGLKRASSYTSARRSTRCKICAACLAPNCGNCTSCRDMLQFGGSGKKKQGCVHRKCMFKVSAPFAGDALCDLPTMVPMRNKSQSVYSMDFSAGRSNNDMLAKGILSGVAMMSSPENVPFVSQRSSELDSDFACHVLPYGFAYSETQLTVPRKSNVVNTFCNSTLTSSTVTPVASTWPVQNENLINERISSSNVETNSQRNFVASSFPDYFDMPIVTPNVGPKPFVQARTMESALHPHGSELNLSSSIANHTLSSLLDNPMTVAPQSSQFSCRRKRKSSKPEHYTADNCFL